MKIIKKDHIIEVVSFIMNRYEWEIKWGSKYDLNPQDLIPLIKAVLSEEDILGHYYADVIEDSFGSDKVKTLILDPKEAKKVDPSKYKMTDEMYEYGIVFFDSQFAWKKEFSDVYGVSWGRALMQWNDQYAGQIWSPLNWASYLLDRLADAHLSFEKFPILETK